MSNSSEGCEEPMGEVIIIVLCSLDQYFSKLNGYMNHLEVLLSCSSDSLDLE